MGCVNTKKQTKDEDKKTEKAAEPSPEQNGGVEKPAEEAPAGGEGTTQAEVEIAVTDEDGAKAGGDADQWLQEAVAIHNRQRALHDVPPVTLCPDLTASAQRWAEHIAKQGALQHTPHGERQLNGETFGENLAYKNMSSSDQSAVDKFDPTAEEIVMMWYNESEKPGYEYGKADMQPGTGHFTQVVWKASTTVGFGRVRVQEGNTAKLFVCGQYLPAGNFQGEFADNVLPLKS